MTRLQFAELTSGIGALVLGVGLGAMFPHWFSPSARLIVFAGGVCHAFGMWDKHHLEAQAPVEAGGGVALYWACWLLLVGTVISLYVER